MSQNQIDRHLLSLLVCPISKQALLPANDKQRQLVAAVLDRSEQADSGAGAGAGAGAEIGAGIGESSYLITDNQRWAYPVRDGVPCLRERDRISLSS